MIRSNSKQARDNIRAYILQGFTPEGYDNAPSETAPFETVAAFIMDTFQNEYRHQIRRYGEQPAFIEWCAGLPSVIDTLYYYNRPAVSDVAQLLDESPAEAARYTEADAERLLSCLIYRELSAGARKAKKGAEK